MKRRTVRSVQGSSHRGTPEVTGNTVIWFGKHKGKYVGDVPHDYLRSLLNRTGRHTPAFLMLCLYIKKILD
jgi:uncharacterized protein (DUF3820 family)